MKVSHTFIDLFSTLSSSQPENQHWFVYDAVCAVVMGPQFRHSFEVSLPSLFSPK